MTAIAAQVERFLKQKEGLLQPETLNLYKGALYRRFLPWCADEGLVDSKFVVDREMEKFKEHLLKDDRIAKATVRTYIRYVRVFLRSEGVETGSFKSPPRQQPYLEPLTPDEFGELAKVAEAHSERDQLIVRVLWETGLQIGELLGLTGNDLIGPDEQQRTYLRIQEHGRGRTETRRVPLVVPELFILLQRFAGMENGFIFKDESGKQFTRNAAARMVNMLAVEARVRRRMRGQNGRSGISPQLFRQSFATRWLSNGGNPIDLMNVLGLNNLQMITYVYARLSRHDTYAEMQGLKDRGAI